MSGTVVTEQAGGAGEVLNRSPTTQPCSRGDSAGPRRRELLPGAGWDAGGWQGTGQQLSKEHPAPTTAALGLGALSIGTGLGAALR